MLLTEGEKGIEAVVICRSSSGLVLWTNQAFATGGDPTETSIACYATAVGTTDLRYMLLGERRMAAIRPEVVLSRKAS
jgi:hypothetical protein